MNPSKLHIETTNGVQPKPINKIKPKKTQGCPVISLPSPNFIETKTISSSSNSPSLSPDLAQLLLPPTHRKSTSFPKIQKLTNQLANKNLENAQLIETNKELQNNINLLLELSKNASLSFQDIQNKYQQSRDQLKKTLEENEKLKKEINELKHQIDYLQKCQKNITFDDIVLFFEKTNPPHSTKIGWNIQKELFINSFRHPNHSIYSDFSKKLYWIINTQGFTAYQTLHSVIRTPALNTLSSIMKSRILNIEASLLDIKFIVSIIEDYLEHFKIKSTFTATLAIDAIAVSPITTEEMKKELNSQARSVLYAFNSQIELRRTVLLRKKYDIMREYNALPDSKKKQKMQENLDEIEYQLSDDFLQNIMMNDIFIFYIEPLDPSYPCFPIHVWLQQGGSANEFIRTLINEVIIQVEKTLIYLLAISTDGDPGHQHLYSNALSFILNASEELEHTHTHYPTLQRVALRWVKLFPNVFWLPPQAST